MSRISMSPLAMALSAVALIVATSATSYAIVVGTAQLQDGAVTTPKLHNNAVTTGKVKDGSLSAKDLSKAGKNALRVRAYATVETTEGVDPTFLPGRMRGFTSVERNAVGEYCLKVDPATGIKVGKITAVVTAEHGWSAGSELEAYFDTTGCGAGGIAVLTDSAGVDSNDVAFSIIVP